MSKPEQEGVIKYQLTFDQRPVSDAEACFHQQVVRYSLSSALTALNASRSVLKARGLIGQDPRRYGGEGFGNISVRISGHTFLISGSQTGHVDLLTDQHVSLVEGVNARLNKLNACGLTKPSSESMTHGVCFQTIDDIGAVIHVHSPDIWCVADALALPSTHQTIAYGTPSMARAVTDLLKSYYSSRYPTIFAMKGHEDGIVAVGKNLQDCTQSLLRCLTQSMAIKGNINE